MTPDNYDGVKTSAIFHYFRFHRPNGGAQYHEKEYLSHWLDRLTSRAKRIECCTKFSCIYREKFNASEFKAAYEEPVKFMINFVKENVRK